MEGHVPVALRRPMAGCRYAVYLFVFAGLVAEAWLHRQPLASAAVYPILAPALVNGAMHWLPLRWLGVVAVAEGVLGVTVLALLAAPLALQFFLAAAIAVSSAALWGAFNLIPLATVAAFGGAVLAAGHWTAGVYALATLLALVAINGVIHRHASLLAGHGARLADQREKLLRYLPRELRDRPAGSRRSERVWLTVAFVDLAGFTGAAEELPSEALDHLLNDYLAAANRLVENGGGSISKFLGDGVLCVFAESGDAVEGRADAATRCVDTLATLPAWIEALNERWRRQGYPHRFGAAAGVASGFCTVGDWGAGERLDFTVIGAPVNLAQRLQAAAGTCGTSLLVDTATAQLANPCSAFLSPVDVSLKGSRVEIAYRPLPECAGLG